MTLGASYLGIPKIEDSKIRDFMHLTMKQGK